MIVLLFPCTLIEASMVIVIGVELGESQRVSSPSASVSLWTWTPPPPPVWDAWLSVCEYGGGGARVSWFCLLVLFTSASLRDWCRKEFDGGSILRVASIASQYS